MENCIFCKIASGEIPSYKVFEDDNFLAFLDISPLNPGHIQVIPKAHFRWVWDVPNLGDYFEVVGRVARALKKTFQIDFVISCVFGEEVPHAHVWLVPRLPNDGHGASLDFSKRQKLPEAEMVTIQKNIQANI